MDLRIDHLYRHPMVLRLVSLLAILAIAVMTTATPAHAALMRMTDGPHHATHAGEMMHGPSDMRAACHEAAQDGPGDSGLCDMACAGVSVCLATPDADTERGHGPDIHVSPAGIRHVGHAPGLVERPPRRRLL